MEVISFVRACVVLWL